MERYIVIKDIYNFRNSGQIKRDIIINGDEFFTLHEAQDFILFQIRIGFVNQTAFKIYKVEEVR